MTTLHPSLSSAVEVVTCNLCGSAAARLLYPSTLKGSGFLPSVEHYCCTSDAYGIHPPIVRCLNCGLVYANPRLNSDSIQAGYAAVRDPLYIEESEARLLTFRRTLDVLDNLIRSPRATPCRLLDVGCYTGVLLQVAAERGWRPIGVEPSIWAARLAAARGLTVINAPLDQVALPPASFDVVTMWDVVEHLTDPAGDLRRIYQLLKPGGVLAIHTIDIESIPARLLGHRWHWLMEMHLYYFSPRTLGRLLTEIGFTLKRTDYPGRYLRLSYLASRLRAMNPPLGALLERIVHRFALGARPVRVNTFDLFTMFATK